MNAAQEEVQQSTTPRWDAKKQELESWFQSIFGDKNPSDLFDVAVFIGGKDYCLEPEQQGSILWSLNFSQINADTKLPLIVKLDPENGYEWVLKGFYEHGDHKRKNLNDRKCHPFLHNMIWACQDGGEIQIVKKGESFQFGRIIPTQENNLNTLRETIETAFEKLVDITPENVSPEVQLAVRQAMKLLDSGRARVAERINGEWVTNQWLKKAVLLSFRINKNRLMDGGNTRYYDKVECKFAGYSEEDFEKAGIRVVPNAVVRKGSYIAPGAILMPSYVNIGAYVDSGTMVDTWVTVGSCAQIGKNCHLSGGVGIGGVLEPLQANPTIIGDNCFIGARSEIVEGVIVEDGCVISMGVFIGQSTKIYNRMTGEITYGRIPAGSVVVSGNLPSEDGKYSLYCAVIIKQVDEKTRSKTGINELLRD